ncbi:hypothetical protein SKAU_G00265760 [Synaphobranchus kaupii]|uniref:Uncharacterized protein n=1 Tax=Synaphobranchus kaupii TaxID=118154 RepID=A0A9Q1IPU9_SYNKA|nr:hypothetical protein SKAU_G00265760 [Synaphobranchus kaupii]
MSPGLECWRALPAGSARPRDSWEIEEGLSPGHIPLCCTGEIRTLSWAVGAMIHPPPCLGEETESRTLYLPKQLASKVKKMESENKRRKYSTSSNDSDTTDSHVTTWSRCSKNTGTNSTWVRQEQKKPSEVSFPRQGLSGAPVLSLQSVKH